MPGLVPGIHVLANEKKDVDGRDKPGHDAAQKAPPYFPGSVGDHSLIGEVFS